MKSSFQLPRGNSVFDNFQVTSLQMPRSFTHCALCRKTCLPIVGEIWQPSSSLIDRSNFSNHLNLPDEIQVVFKHALGKAQEALLKPSTVRGVPRTINTILAPKNVTPSNLHSEAGTAGTDRT
ncbi:hypothetical protein VTL71DRAFT_8230 [Oculimacula yallundae]|uniref:Uncharacterized protein n=1 Tax=Oculimacula yallundae TaxID=86028 RepID=A0ABR4CX86_9HELO